MSTDYGITGGKELVEKSKEFIKEMEALVLKRSVDSLTRPRGLLPKQKLLGRIMHCFVIMLKDTKL